jgi:hypothetical protein
LGLLAADRLCDLATLRVRLLAPELRRGLAGNRPRGRRSVVTRIRLCGGLGLDSRRGLTGYPLRRGLAASSLRRWVADDPLRRPRLAAP